VKDLEAVTDFFAEKGAALSEGDTPDRIAVDVAATLGLMFEFTSAS
jgi:hypothetical protein